MSNLRFVGLDVHKDTIVVAVAEPGQGEAEQLGTFPHDVPKLLKKLVKLVGGDVSRLRVCYEAGPTGIGLCRRLKAASIDCIVVAPALVPQLGQRVKTDRRDARRLAHFLRSGDLTAVWVPDEKTEALRDLERLRDGAKNAERVARHQLEKFLLRNERIFRDGRHWTKKHGEKKPDRKSSGPAPASTPGPALRLRFRRAVPSAQAILDRDARHNRRQPPKSPIPSRREDRRRIRSCGSDPRISV